MGEMLNDREKKYWEAYYINNKDPQKETPFASFVAGYLDSGKDLIELGCGNARDSLYFSKLGLFVTGVDQCEGEIAYLNGRYHTSKLSFHVGDFTRMEKNRQYDYIYSRFTLHSISDEAEDRVISWAFSSLRDTGLFFIEVRSIKDEMFRYGEKISKNEAMTDHYRRFAEFDKLEGKLTKAGLLEEYSVEAQGLAQYKDEDPVIIRFIVKK